MLRFESNMPKGLKQTSELITISSSCQMVAPDTFLEKEIELQLNALDNEVFVILGVDILLRPPWCVDAANTAVKAQLSNRRLNGYYGLASNAVFASEENWMMTEYAGGFNNENFAGWNLNTSGGPKTNMEYLGIIATNNFFAAIDSVLTGRSGDNSFSFKVYGYRAKADSATYAALVQSELLSS
ncbi:MAG: hypothetical protein ACTSRU_20985 [Candidatus Hodarchaeales archaeon]